MNPLLFLSVLTLVWAASAHAKLPNWEFWKDEHPFSIELTGNPNLAELLRAQLSSERKNNPDILAINDSASLAQHEIGVLESILRTQGYYNGRVSLKNIDGLKYQVDAGSQFFIQQLILDLPDSTPPLPSLALSQGDPLLADAVFNALEQIKHHYSQYACYYPLEVKYQVKIDKTTAAAQVRIYLASTTQAQFGESRFHGAPSVNEPFLQYYLAHQTGDCFKQAPLDKMRLNLLKSDLFTSADVQTRLDGDRVLTDIYLTERKPRTIKGGLSYDGDNKEGLSLGWENRNLWGNGEHLSLTGEQNRIQGDYSARLTLPHILHPQQNLILSAEYKPEDSPSSQSDTEILSASLERHFSEQFIVSLGVETELIQEKNTRRSGLISLPARLYLNNTDALLNPSQGWALTLGAASTWDAYHPEIQFQNQTIAASFYYTYVRPKGITPTLAMRFASGTIGGEALQSIPATKRFYVGGGGSVRGYPYQSLGALEEGKPSGGLSYAESSLELRLRWGEDWGLAVFYDGGWAYPDANWHWGEQFLWGYGVGLRYYTLFAPIRLDVARPATPRTGIDDPYQIYVSLGQAF